MIPRARLPQDLALGHRRLNLTTHPEPWKTARSALWCARHYGDLAGLVRREAELTGTGRVAVIAPPAEIAQTAAALGLVPGPDLDAPVTLLTPELAKGLEFDSVVIIDPAGIAQASPRGRADLYVALTGRSVRRPGGIAQVFCAVLAWLTGLAAVGQLWRPASSAFFISARTLRSRPPSQISGP